MREIKNKFSESLLFLGVITLKKKNKKFINI